jgi:hypothetical protein
MTTPPAQRSGWYGFLLKEGDPVVITEEGVAAGHRSGARGIFERVVVGDTGELFIVVRVANGWRTHYPAAVWKPVCA